MSSQKGNAQRNRPQKHQNKFAFKNTLHDKTQQTKQMNSLDLAGLCQRCREVIQWKIKYKKYKALTQPKTCAKCSKKNVKQAYYVICTTCASGSNICCKCLEKKDILQQPGLSVAEQMSQDSQLQQELEMLPERKRRTFFRLQASGKLTDENPTSLHVGASGDDFDDDNDSDDFDDDSEEFQQCRDKDENKTQTASDNQTTTSETNIKMDNAREDNCSRDSSQSETSSSIDEVKSKLKGCDLK